MNATLIYELNGKFTRDSNLLHNGKPFFRKMTNDKCELELCKLLMNNPHKNIVKLYGISDNYIDMELLNTNIEDVNVISETMLDVKTHLQHLGIIYIDWRFSNIGISEGCDPQFKLFDFDLSGLINTETNEWILEPLKCWSYREAIENGNEIPIDIDNCAFDVGITNGTYIM